MQSHYQSLVNKINNAIKNNLHQIRFTIIELADLYFYCYDQIEIYYLFEKHMDDEKHLCVSDGRWISNENNIVSIDSKHFFYIKNDIPLTNSDSDWLYMSNMAKYWNKLKNYIKNLLIKEFNENEYMFNYEIMVAELRNYFIYS